MLDAVFGVFSSSGIGALVGLVGSWLTKQEERKNLELTLNHEKVMFQLKSTQQQEQNQHELKLAEQNLASVKEAGEQAVELVEASAFVASQQSNTSLSNRFAELIRGLMRPVITIYLLSIATVIALQINAYMDGAMAQLQQQELMVMYQNTLDKIMFLTTTAVTWWFGSRPSQSRK